MSRPLRKSLLALTLAGAAGALHPLHAQQTLAVNYLASAKPVRIEGQKLHAYAVKPARPLDEETLRATLGRVKENSGASLERVSELKGNIENQTWFRSSKDASAVLRIDNRSGDLLLNGGLAGYSGEGDTAGLPEGEDAAKLALAQAEKFFPLPQRGELVLAHVGGLNLGVHREDGTTALYRKLVSVRFNRKLGDLPVLGRSRLSVQLGERGRLQGMVRRWPEVEAREIRTEELLPSDAIAKSLEARLRSEAHGATRAVVKSTDLVLYDSGEAIEPAIHIVASLHYEVPVVNSRVVGERRRLDVPYDSFEPVLRNTKAHYPFQHSAEAARAIHEDKPMTVPLREPDEVERD